MKQVVPGSITGVTDDSRKVEPGNLFVAIRGLRADSHLFISDAVERGARGVVVERDIPAYGDVAIVRASDSPDALGRLAEAWHGNPAKAMTMVGVTGTNGKTTTTYLLEAVFAAAGDVGAVARDITEVTGDLAPQADGDGGGGGGGPPGSGRWPRG